MGMGRGALGNDSQTVPWRARRVSSKRFPTTLHLLSPLVLVTGATGLVGSELTRQLVLHEKPVRILRRQRSNLDLLGDVQHRVEHIFGDVTDPASLADAFEGVTHVYHQYTIRVDEGERDAMVAALRQEHGVGTGVYYPIPNHRLESLARYAPDHELVGGWGTFGGGGDAAFGGRGRHLTMLGAGCANQIPDGDTPAAARSAALPPATLQDPRALFSVVLDRALFDGDLPRYSS